MNAHPNLIGLGLCAIPQAARLAEVAPAQVRGWVHGYRARAVARGVKMGRKPKLTPHQIKEALRRRDAGEPMREIARSYSVSHSTISRLSQ